MVRFQITEPEIQAVVANFYARVRQHPELGPIFAPHVQDWPSHEAKIVAFWRGAITGQGGYDGNPMRAHISAGNIAPRNFSAWLDLFEAALADELPMHTQRLWAELAHRIGHGLKSGLDFNHRRLATG